MTKGSNFHPARISGHQKMLRSKAANDQFDEDQANKAKRKKIIKPLDLSKGDWSTK